MRGRPYLAVIFVVGSLLRHRGFPNSILNRLSGSPFAPPYATVPQRQWHCNAGICRQGICPNHVPSHRNACCMMGKCRMSIGGTQCRSKFSWWVSFDCLSVIVISNSWWSPLMSSSTSISSPSSKFWRHSGGILAAFWRHSGGILAAFWRAPWAYAFLRSSQRFR